MIEIDDLPTPALLIDLERLEANIEAMAAKTDRLGVHLRPHIKTHKSIEIARMQQHSGARGLTVSTLYEARVFLDHGFDDLTWAFPVILGRIDEARALAERGTLRLVVDSHAAIDALEATGFPFHVWLKVDCGYHRAGVDPESALALTLVERLARSGPLRFDGLLTHSGHAYRATSRDALRRVADEERRVLTSFAEICRERGFEVAALSVGSTPAMSAVETLDGIDEARPGNYVFYDATQVALGACRVADCAATVLASVVSSQPGARHAVVDAGALALSKDPGPHPPGTSNLGRIFTDYEASLLDPEVHLTALSQEHGMLSAPFAVGERVRLLPNHSCLTVACFDWAAAVRGNRVVARWRIWNGREPEPVDSL